MKKQLFFLRTKMTTALMLIGVLLMAMQANAQTLYVDEAATGLNNGSSWANAFTSLGNALDSTWHNVAIKEVRIAQGTYVPNHYMYHFTTGIEIASTIPDQKRFHLRSGLKVRGSYPTGGGAQNVALCNTILSGVLNATDTCTNIIFSLNNGTANDTNFIEGVHIKYTKQGYYNYEYISGYGYINDFSNSAIAHYGGGTIHVKNSNISNCRPAVIDVLNLNAVTNVVENCKIFDNTSGPYGGGGLQTPNGGGKAIFKNNELYNITSYNFGTMYADTIIATGNNYHNNNVSQMILLQGPGSATGFIKFSNNTISNHTGVSYLGQINNCFLAVMDSNIINNNNSSTGFSTNVNSFFAKGNQISNNTMPQGMFYGSAISKNYTANIFTNNNWNNGYSIYCPNTTNDYGNTIIKNNIFNNNNGYSAISLYQLSPTSTSLTDSIIGNSFLNDTATQNEVNIYSPTTIYMNKNIFENNVSSYSLMDIYSSQNNCQVFNNVFYKNKGINPYYGVLNLSSYNSLNLPDTVVNNVFIKNEYDFLLNDKRMRASNNTFYANKAEYGLRVIGATLDSSKITNNIFSKNYNATNTYNDFQVGNVANNSLQNNTFTDSNTYVWLQANANVIVSNNTYNQYPNFIDTTNLIGADNIWGTADDGLNLKPTSTSINNGLNSFVPASIATDIKNFPRIFGTIVDRGAYESFVTIPPLSATGSAPNILCNGGTTNATLNITGGTAPFTTTPSPNGLVAGSYTFTVTDTYGWSVTTMLTITQPTAIAPIASATNAVCGGNGSLTFSATGGTGAITYKVNGVTQTSPYTTAIGTYTIIATDANTCSVSTIQTITQPSVIALSATATNALCNGVNGSLTFSATSGTGTITYKVNGVTQTSPYTTAAGAYTIIATDANACSVSAVQTITQPNNISVTTIITPAQCKGSNGSFTMAATGGTGAVSFMVNGVAKTSPVMAIAGAYTIIATDANGCTKTKTLIITEPADVLALNLSVAVPLCAYNNATLTASPSGGLSTNFTTLGFGISGSIYTPLFSGGPLTFPFQTSFDSVVFVTTSDVGCIDSHRVKINMPTNIELLTDSSTSPDCYGTNGIIDFELTGGVAPYTHALSQIEDDEGVYQTIIYNPALPILLPYTAVFNTSMPSDYIYHILTTDAVGCTYFYDYTLAANTQMIIDATHTINCTSANININGMLLGVGNTTYQLNGVPVAVGTYTVNTPSIFTITAVNELGCTTNTIIDLSTMATVPLTITTAITNPISTNALGTIMFSTTGGTGAITYNVNGVIQSSPYTTAAGTYTIIATDANACSVSAVSTITQPSVLALTATASNPLCNNENGFLTFNATGGTGAITYMVNGVIQTSPYATVAGTYTIIATDVNAYTISSVQTIMQPSIISLTVTPINSLCSAGNGSLTFSTTGGTGSINYLVNGDPQSSPFATAAGTYTIIATDSNACSVSSVQIITQPNAIVLSSNATNPLCNSAIGSLTFNASGGTGDITYIVNGVAQISPFATTDGTYTIVAIDTNGCSVATVQVITQLTSVTYYYDADGDGYGNVNNQIQSCYGAPNFYVANKLDCNDNNASINPAATEIANGIDDNCNGLIDENTNNFLTVSIKMFLAGAYDDNTGLMHDSLRVKGLLPILDPYTIAPYNTIFTHVNNSIVAMIGPSVLSTAGANAIVDWVFIQLRSGADSSIVVATKAALVQRDGDVVDAADGISAVSFVNTVAGNYYISIGHRNHLGIMGSSKYSLSSTNTAIDFSDVGMPLFSFAGASSNNLPLTGPTRLLGGKRTLYAGNCNISIAQNASKLIGYNNFGYSDRTALFGATSGTNTITGYSIFDCDMNGYTRFNGLNPDRLVILNNCAKSNIITVKQQTPN
jgi:Putative metal-binding motif/SprB repeat